jgi:hypothetical protein
VTTDPAPGNGAQNAGTTEILTTSQDGNASQLEPIITMPNDELIATTKRNLDEAISQFMAANYGHGLVIDWFVIAETVDANLDAETDNHSLYVGTSPTMSSWKLFGMTQKMAQFAYSQQ